MSRASKRLVTVALPLVTAAAASLGASSAAAASGAPAPETLWQVKTSDG